MKSIENFYDRRILIVSILLYLSFTILLPNLDRAEDAVPSAASFPIGALSIKESDVIITPKKDYVHILWDAFPYRSELPQHLDDSFFKKTAKDLVRTMGLKKYPNQTQFKVDIVKFPQRDNYGDPRWDSVIVLKKMKASVSAGRIKIELNPKLP